MIVAKSEKGAARDWWFIYKTPISTGTEKNKGYDYFYYDDSSQNFVLSTHKINEEKGALFETLAMLFDTDNSDVGYIVYNDEHADSENNKGGKGHCKGILAFDKKNDQAVFLLHSTPRFPSHNETRFPEKEAIYGQTFLCITLENYESANKIAAQMLCQQNPQILIESSKMPRSIGAEEALFCLYKGIGIKESVTPENLQLKSKAGKEFLLIAKSKKWDKDFWIDLVCPTLKADFTVETWRRGKVSPEKDDTSDFVDEDVLSLCFVASKATHYSWPYTKDHAKWGVAIKNNDNDKPWICIADMNRMESQKNRGGASLCFLEENLWKALVRAETAVQDFDKSSKNLIKQ